MKRLWVTIFIILLAFLPTVESATSNDFVKISVQDENFFTHKNIIDADYFLGTDKIFYGSNKGEIKIKVYFTEKDGLTSQNYKIGIESHTGKQFLVSKVKIGDTEIEIDDPIFSDSFIFNQNIQADGGKLEEIEIELSFDPEEIGIREEIDIILYDAFGNILLVDDPFISGFSCRQKGTLNTDGIGLGGNITGDHSILYYIDPSNVEFWTCDTLGTGNGITFAQSDELTEYDFDIEDFNNTDNNAWFWVEVTETFPSGSDLETWFYYGGVDVDNSDGVSAYPADYKLVYHSNETSGTNIPDATGTDDITLNSAGAWDSKGKIGGALDYANNNRGDSGDTGTTPTDFTALAWIKLQGLGANDDILGLGTVATTMQRRQTAPCANQIAFTGSTQLCGASTITLNAWTFASVTFADGTNTKTVYTNATDKASEVDAITQVPTFYVSRSAGFTGNEFFGLIDEIKLINRVLSDDEILLLFNSEDLNLITFEAEQTSLSDLNISVFQENGTQVHLSDLNILFATGDIGGDLNRTNVNSPQIYADLNSGSYTIVVSKEGWDTNTVILSDLIQDTNLTITLNKVIYPRFAQFTTIGTTNTTDSAYQTINTFRFETNFGSTTATDVGCTFWASSNNGSAKSAFWRIQTSNTAVDWVTRKETERTMIANTTGASIYIASPDYNITDGNHFFRIQHRRQIGASFDLNTNDVVCHNFIARDQNNLLIPDFHNEQVGLSTSSTVFEKLAVRDFNTNGFNGFFYYYGDLIYNQSIAKGTSSVILGLLGIADSNSSEFQRTTLSGSIGIGAITGLIKNLDASTTFTAEAYGKTTAGTISFDTNFHLKHLNQRAGEFDINKGLSGTTLTTTSYSQLLSIPITVSESGDFRAMTVLPFSCSVANCDFNIIMQMGDQNSFSHMRTSNGTSGDIGILMNQFIFEDLPNGSTNLIVWAKTSTGTITIEGGSVSVVHITSTTVFQTNAPLIPTIINPVNGSTVSGTAVDFNCLSTDPNLDPLVFDVNVINRDTNAFALNLVSAGDGNGTFDSNSLANGLYSIDCRVTEVTGDAFSSVFDNSDYSFTIDNPRPATVTINFPNGGESIILTSIVDINFTIDDEGSGSWLVDINFSTSSAQSSGTVIANDLNTLGAGIICVVNGNIRECIVSWNTTGVAVGNYFILVSATDEIGEKGFDSSDATFSITVRRSGEGYERYFAPDDPRKDLIDKNKFVNPELVRNESSIIRENENQSQMLMGIIILLGVIIILGIIFLFRRKK